MNNPYSVIITGIKSSYHFRISPRVHKTLLGSFILGLLTLFLLAISVQWLFSLVDKQEIKINSTEDINYSLSVDNRYLSQQLSHKQQEIERLTSLLNSIEVNEDNPELKQDNIFAQIIQSPEEKTMMLQSIPNGYPLKGRVRISSSFGYRIHPVHKHRHFHRGTDMAARKGAPVYATADGVVKYVGNRNGFGKTMVIKHKYGFETLYAHLSDYKLKKGVTVDRGQIIALAGQSGVATGPHLHYEVHFNKKQLNPSYFLRWNKNNYSSIFSNIKSVPWHFLTNLARIQYIKEKASSQVGAL